MTCASCAARIESELERLPGVRAQVNFATERARVSFQAPVTAEDLVGAVAEAVELGRALPVLPGELGGVLDAHPSLLGAVDEEQATERPPGLAAEVVAVLLVEDQHPLAREGELVGHDEAREAGADDDDVRGERGGLDHRVSCWS